MPDRTLTAAGLAGSEPLDYAAISIPIETPGASPRGRRAEALSRGSHLRAGSRILHAIEPRPDARNVPGTPPADPGRAPAAGRVLVLSHHERDFPGGASIADRALAAELAGLGYEVDLLFYGDLLPARVRGIWRQLLFPWAAALAFLRRHARQRYDVVESTAGDAWVIGLALALSRRRPLLSIRTHGLEHRRARLDLERRRRTGQLPAWPSRLYHYRYRLAEVARDLRRADAVFFLNEEDRRHGVDVLGLAPARVHAIPNGLPPHLLGASWRGPGPVSEILFLGRWTPDKGADLLPHIARLAFASNPRLRLTCAGVDVPEERVLADFHPTDRGRIRTIRRYDHRELPEILAGHGTLLLPSPAEGCSLALLEGMAGGLVPLACRTGYAADVLRQGENGFLFTPGDAEGFARALLALADDPGAAGIGRRAREAAEAHSWSALAERRVAIWNQASARLTRP